MYWILYQDITSYNCKHIMKDNIIGLHIQNTLIIEFKMSRNLINGLIWYVG